MTPAFQGIQTGTIFQLELHLVMDDHLLDILYTGIV